jgi:hypothetical protein
MDYLFELIQSLDRMRQLPNPIVPLFVGYVFPELNLFPMPFAAKGYKISPSLQIVAG